MPRVILVVTACIVQGCVPSYSAKEIEAWVIDAETQTPIEGVVVVAHWALKFGAEGGLQRDLELMESVTDADGRFYFPAWGPKEAPARIPWYARLQNADPEIIVFKSGYEPRIVYNDRNAPPYGLLGGPRVRTSLWHGKKIAMKRFVGDLDRYGTIVGGVLTGVSWGECGWAKIPRMMLALNVEGEKLSAMKIPHAIPTIRDLEDTARGHDCAPVREVLERYRP